MKARTPVRHASAPGTGLRSLQEAIQRKRRVDLAQLPTPLEEAPHLSRRLGVRVLVKRDDQTGLALGGNKARKLEFLIGDALESGADTVVTTGGSQSNHARMAAAACRKVGLACHLILDRGAHPEPQGNMLLDALLGANVHMIESADPQIAVAEMDTLASALRVDGRKPYIIPRGGSVPVGASGYASFVLELLDQLRATGEGSTYLYLGTGSTGTHSGVLAGVLATGADIAVQGISVSRSTAEQTTKILALTSQTLRYLGLGTDVPSARVAVDDRYRGPGYGQPTPATMHAIVTAAQDEGLILDPVYTGKAMAGLIAHAAEGKFRSTDTVIFLHTGGAPALFAYNREMMTVLEAMNS